MSKLRLTTLSSLLLASASVMAVDVAQEPLFTSQQATPNVMFVLDDSGSMDWEILTDYHYSSARYDVDFRRQWARGGDHHGKWDIDTNAKSRKAITDGSFISYSGRCKDKSVDGICGNRHDYNGIAKNYSDWVYQAYFRGHEHGGEQCKVTTKPAYNEKWIYHRAYSWGSCEPTGGTSDASDILTSPIQFASVDRRLISESFDDNLFNAPSMGLIPDILAAITGSSNAMAAGPCIIETLAASTVNRGYYDHTPGSSVDARDPVVMAACNAAPSTEYVSQSTWQRDALLDWIVPKPGYTISTPERYALDLNGDGIIQPKYNSLPSDQQFHVQDEWQGASIDYHYLYPLADRSYKGVDIYEDCNGNAEHSAVYACKHLQYPNYPDDYPYDASIGEVATANNLVGNERILTLPDRTHPQTRGPSAIYPWALPPREQRFSDIKWAGGKSPAGTHHAVSQYDPWPIISDWRVRSADFNVMYYSPDYEYLPWVGLNDANFNSAKSNPQIGTDGYVIESDLARVIDGVEAGFVYAVSLDDAGFFRRLFKPKSGVTGECGYEGNTTARGATLNNEFWTWAAKSEDGITDLSWSQFRNLPEAVTGRKDGIGIRDPGTGRITIASDKICTPYLDEGNGLVDLWDSRYRATVTNGQIVVQKIRRSPHMFGEKMYPDGLDKDRTATNTNTNVPYLITAVPTQHYYAALHTDIDHVATYTAGASYPVDGVCEVVLGFNPADSSLCRTVDSVKQNVANWYQYSRKRSFVAKSAIASVMNELPNLRYGISSSSSTAGVPSLFSPLPTGVAPYTAHNTSIITDMFSYKWPAKGTPLRSALVNAGEYFKGDAPTPHNVSPITESCQRNYAVMLTDGYWTPDVVTGIGDADGDGYFNNDSTLADVAKHYYDTDLSPLANKVPTTEFDTNNKQHLTTVGISFGVDGTLKDKNNNGWPGDSVGSSLIEASDWGNPGLKPEYKINDLWHAAYNSRGKFLAAKNPEELYNSIREAVLLSTSTVGSSSSLASNSNVISSSTHIYQTTFENTDWAGDVIAYTLKPNGELNGKLWSAQEELDKPLFTHSLRRIITSDSAGNGIPFRWTSLDASYKAALSIKWPNTAAPSNTIIAEKLGKDQVDYIRGKEKTGFRVRKHRLGDIVQSKPVYVGAPNSAYPDTFGMPGKRYMDFFNANSTRTPMVYAGANDGMLHAFNEVNGKEMFGYIPSMLQGKLNRLTHLGTRVQPFTHQYYVNASPTVTDAFFPIANEWRTALVGGLGAGGKGVYALNVTNAPTSLDTEAVIANRVLWEFSSDDDIDMGMGGNEPVIARLQNGKWAAIFGNGWNSTNHKSVIFIVDLETGALIKKINTNVGDIVNQNGMAPPSVVDLDGDSIADVIYAGDLQGNLWKIDISLALPSAWNIALSGQPLLKATDGNAVKQSITQKPLVSRHPLGIKAGVLIYVGTGRYLGFSDNSYSTAKDSLYAVWDHINNVTPAARGNMLQQKMLTELTAGSAEVRVTTDYPITWLAPNVTLSTSGWESNVVDHGWFIDLDSSGERVAAAPVLRGNTILFSTLLPSNDPCTGGVTGWLMALNAETGARFDSPRIDINGDNNFDASDSVDWTDSSGTAQTSAVSGIKSTSGIPSAPIVLSNGQGSGSTGRVLTDSSGANIGGVNINDANGFGRQSWIQIR